MEVLAAKKRRSENYNVVFLLRLAVDPAATAARPFTRPGHAARLLCMPLRWLRNSTPAILHRGSLPRKGRKTSEKCNVAAERDVRGCGPGASLEMDLDVVEYRPAMSPGSSLPKVKWGAWKESKDAFGAVWLRGFVAAGAKARKAGEVVAIAGTWQTQWQVQHKKKDELAGEQGAKSVGEPKAADRLFCRLGAFTRLISFHPFHPFTPHQQHQHHDLSAQRVPPPPCRLWRGGLVQRPPLQVRRGTRAPSQNAFPRPSPPR